MVKNDYMNFNIKEIIENMIYKGIGKCDKCGNIEEVKKYHGQFLCLNCIKKEYPKGLYI